MTNKKRQEIIDYLEMGDKFSDILIKELERPDITGYEKRTYSGLLDAMNSATELYCAMTEWPDNVSFELANPDVKDEEEIILQRGPLTINAVNQVSNYVKDLPLSSEQNNQLIQLMVKMLVDAEREGFIQGFKVCLDAVRNGGFKGLEDKVLKVTKFENNMYNDFASATENERKTEEAEEKDKLGLVFNTVYGEDELKVLKDCTVYLIKDVENNEKNFYGTEFVFHNEKTGKYIGLLIDNDGELSLSQWY